MSYTISRISRRYLNKIKEKGKENVLRPPSYRPAGERPLNFVIWLCLILFIPAFYFSWMAGIALVVLALILFGIKDWLIQDDHSIIRIYGPFGRARFIVEDLMRDKYLQYFNETNTDGRPIPKIVRDYIYQKAHGVKALSSFGTELDSYDQENTANVRILHRNFPGEVKKNDSYAVEVGSWREGIRPYTVKNTLNISAMSFGSLNYRACEAMSIGSKDVCYVNTGEGGFGPHGVAGNDVVFQVGTGKFGVGDSVTLPDGSTTRKLNDQLMVDLVKQHDNIRMIEIKISQGAKPGKGGHLPGVKVTPEIAAVRKVQPYKSVISPSQHMEVAGANPRETIDNLMKFIKHVRGLTKLPVGIKICFGNLTEIDLLVDAMKATNNGPDHIQVDGADGGTGAAPNLFLNYVGYGSSVETLAVLDKKLKEAGIRDKVSLCSSGRLFTPAHAALAFAYGADYIATARGAMLALGCIQALQCHTGHCPTGITTHNKWRVRGIVVPEKATRVHMYLSGFHNEMMEIAHVLGHNDPRDITPKDVKILNLNFNGYFNNGDEMVDMVSKGSYDI